MCNFFRPLLQKNKIQKIIPTYYLHPRPTNSLIIKHFHLIPIPLSRIKCFSFAIPMVRHTSAVLVRLPPQSMGQYFSNRTANDIWPISRVSCKSLLCPGISSRVASVAHRPTHLLRTRDPSSSR